MYDKNVLILHLFIAITLPSSYGFPQLRSSQDEKTGGDLDDTDSLINNPTWVSISSTSDLLLMSPEPVGIEGVVHLYLCRTQVSGGRYKPGKLWAHNGRVSCSVGDEGENSETTFQILNAARGTTSWIPVSGPAPSNAIVGGTHGNGRNAHVCRATSGGALIPGSYYGGTNDCYVTRDGSEYSVKTNIELLVVNEYGRRV